VQAFRNAFDPGHEVVDRGILRERFSVVSICNRNTIRLAPIQKCLPGGFVFEGMPLVQQVIRIQKILPSAIGTAP